MLEKCFEFIYIATVLLFNSMRSYVSINDYLVCRELSFESARLQTVLQESMCMFLLSRCISAEYIAVVYHFVICKFFECSCGTSQRESLE